MAITIEVSKCQFDSHTVTISSPVEADGGDHYCVIYFGDPALRYLVSVKLDGVAQTDSCGMYFTSAGESYVLELKHNGAAPPTIKWTYEVSALYAPGWATLKGKITLDLEACCNIPNRWWVYPSSWSADFTGGSTIAGGAPATAACSSATSCGPLYDVVLHVPWTGTGTDLDFQAVTNSSADFYAAVLSGTYSGSGSFSGLDSMVVGCSYSVTVTKAANSWLLSYSCTITPTAFGGSACHGTVRSAISPVQSNVVANVKDCGAVMCSMTLSLQAQDGFWPYILVACGINVKLGYRE